MAKVFHRTDLSAPWRVGGGFRSGITILILAGLLLGGCAGPAEVPAAAARQPVLRLNISPESPGFGSVEAANLPRGIVAEIGELDFSEDEWYAVFAVYTGTEPPAGGDKPPVAGSYSVEDGMLRFRPRYPFVTGLSYTARLDLGRAALGRGDLPPIVAGFTLPGQETRPATRVTELYPTARELPENLLRLYLHFSAPMSRGEAYEHVRLVRDADGAEVAAPFVEIEQELWDGEMRRLTLFFDPGRIKRGLRPHEEVGPPLARGESYRLIVDADWLDARGLPLEHGLERRFAVTAADRTSPDPAEWRLEPPAADSREALVLRFPEPLDHGLLRRVLRVRDSRGGLVEGRVDVGEEETRWALTPEDAWAAGEYAVEIETILEDVAGNNLKGVFDADLKKLSEKRMEADMLSLAFLVSGAS